MKVSLCKKKKLLKNSKDVRETDILLAELEPLDWLQGQIAGSSLLLRTTKKQLDITLCCRSIFGRKLKLYMESENPLTY